MNRETLLANGGVSPEAVEATLEFWESYETDDSTGMLETLTVDKEADGLGIFRLRSRKLSNVMFNWQRFITETLIAIVGAVNNRDSNPFLSILLGLKAIQSAAGLTEVKLDENSSKVAVELHYISWTGAEYQFVDIAMLEKKCSAVKEFENGLQQLFKLGVARLDLRGTAIVMTESIVLVRQSGQA